MTKTEKAPSRLPKEAPASRRKRRVLRVVGMGGSAGALEAFERFLSEVPRTPEKRSGGLHLVTGGPTLIEASVDAVLLPRHAESDGSIQLALVDVTERRAAEAEKSRLVGELEASLARIKRLTGLLPICASCKRIRDDSGYWQQVEAYITDHSGAEFSHGLCPECIGKLYTGCRK